MLYYIVEQLFLGIIFGVVNTYDVMNDLDRNDSGNYYKKLHLITIELAHFLHLHIIFFSP